MDTNAWYKLALTAISLTLQCQAAHGQTTTEPLPDEPAAPAFAYGMWEAASERSARQPFADSVGGDFGESINLYDGRLYFSVVDLSVPGTGPVVELRRSFSVTETPESDQQVRGRLGGLKDWDLDVPRISSVADSLTGWVVDAANRNARCSSGARPPAAAGFDADAYWAGYKLEIPSRVSETLLANTTTLRPQPNGTYPWTTKQGWMLSCLPATKNGYAGEGFVALSPDGTRYFLDWALTKAYSGMIGKPISTQTRGDVNAKLGRVVVYLVATKVVDRFGNWVEYSYSGNRLSAITANTVNGTDPRSVSLTYLGDDLTGATASRRSVTYGYAQGRLSSVQYGDGSKWSYVANGSTFIDNSDEGSVSSTRCGSHFSFGEPFTYEVTSPGGAKAKYTLKYRDHALLNAPGYCEVWQYGHPADPGTPSTLRNFAFWRVPPYFQNYTLERKEVTGPGLPTLVWTYDYSQDIAGTSAQLSAGCAANPSSCPASKVVSVTGPTGFDQYWYGDLYRVNAGQLLRSQRGNSATSILQAEELSYVTSDEADQSPFGNAAGAWIHNYSDPLPAKYRPLKLRTITRDGTRYTWKVFAFDRFARPTVIERSTAPAP